MAVGEALRADTSTLNTALSNAGQASSLIQVIDGALSSINEIIQRQKSLAVQANAATLTNAERAFLDQEYQALSLETTRIVTNTEFNGVAVLNGDLSAGVATQVGIAATDTITITLAAQTALSLGGDLTSQANAVTASGAADTGLTAVTTARATVGALQSRFNFASATLEASIQNIDAARGGFLDADISAESTSFR